MLDFIEEMESNSDGKPVFPVAELREHLPQAFLDQLDEMAKINAKVESIESELKIDIRALLKLDSEDQDPPDSKGWLQNLGQAFNNLGNAVFGDHSYEIEALGQEYLDQATYRNDVDSEDGVGTGSFVECGWRDGAYGTPTHIEVKIGSFCRDEDGEIIQEKNGKSYASLKLNLGENGFNSYSVDGAGTEPEGSWEAPNTPDMKGKAVEFLKLASKLGNDEYVAVSDARLLLESGRWMSVNETLKQVEQLDVK